MNISYLSLPWAVQQTSAVYTCGALHYSALLYYALHCTALHCTAILCTALLCTALHCTAPPYSVIRPYRLRQEGAMQQTGPTGVGRQGQAGRGRQEQGYTGEGRVRQDTGCRTQDTGHRTQDTGHRTPAAGCRISAGGPGTGLRCPRTPFRPHTLCTTILCTVHHNTMHYALQY
jgi:hypothetical protein